jgi:NAD-dependent SIR2 family protein deacetylase
MHKYFCHACVNSFYIPHKDYVETEGFPQCSECGQSGRTPDIEHKGEIYPHAYKVTRTWHVEAFHHQEALEKTKNWNHDSISVSRIKTEEPFYE